MRKIILITAILMLSGCCDRTSSPPTADAKRLINQGFSLHESPSTPAGIRKYGGMTDYNNTYIPEAEDVDFIQMPSGPKCVLYTGAINALDCDWVGFHQAQKRKHPVKVIIDTILDVIPDEKQEMSYPYK